MASKKQLSNYEIKTDMDKWHTNSEPEPKPISYLQKIRNQNQNQNQYAWAAIIKTNATTNMIFLKDSY